MINNIWDVILNDKEPFSTKKYLLKLNWIEYCIIFYIVGRLVSEIVELWDQGARDYCSQLWKILDFFMITTFITSFSLKAISYR